MKKFILTFLSGLISIVILTFANSVQAGLAIPYTPDADTMHLWHLNEVGGTNALDAADLNTNTYPIELTNLGVPNPGNIPTPPYTNTSLGNPGPPGLTYAYSGSTKQHLLYGGNYPDVGNFCNPTTGAFTFEALILISNSISSIDAEILTGDSGGAITARGWQWRIENGTMEWDLLGGSTDNDFKPALPLSGVDAAKVGSWYHVAVTFTGQSPTNGDPVDQLKMYWTLLDPGRTYADLLFAQNDVTNSVLVNGVRPLNGSPEGATAPNLGIGGSGRNTGSNPGNNEGLIGSMCEVRITDLCLQSNQMAFVAGGAFPPKVTAQPPPALLVGYGQPLIISPSVSASQPVSYQWYQNGTNVPSQTNSTLNVSSAIFGNGGPYYLITTNAYGAATTSVSQVTIGAIVDELYSTGIVSNQVSSGGVSDPNYTMVQSSNPSFLGPDEMIWFWLGPIEFAVNNGSYAPTNGSSEWISPQGNAGGNAPGDPAGNYTIRTKILLDQVSPTNMMFQSGMEIDGTITNILINGQSTGFNYPGVPALYANYITLSNYNNTMVFTASGPTFTTVVETNSAANFFVPGVNTIDFVLNTTGAAAIRMDSPTGVGYALPAGLPTIIQQPASETVRDANLTETGCSASFSVVALGRPPLTYQWYSNGFLLPGGTIRTLTYLNPAAGLQGTNFQVVVANSSGSVTSMVATLTLAGTNQFPIAPNYTNYVYENQTIDFDLSLLFNAALFPDNDPGTITTYDTVTTNGVGLNPITGTLLSYTPNQDYIGSDLWTYTVSDAQGDTAVGTNYIQVIAQKLPTVNAPTFSAGNFIMSGSGGSPGGQYYILGSPDLLTPVSSWTVVATGSFDSLGNFSIKLPTNTGAPASFYLLELP